MDETQNYSIEATFQFVSTGPDDWAGIAFGGNFSAYGYAFEASPKGEFRLNTYHYYDYHSLAKGGGGEPVGENEPFTLKVERIGDRVGYFFNGKKVYESYPRKFWGFETGFLISPTSPTGGGPVGHYPSCL